MVGTPLPRRICNVAKRNLMNLFVNREGRRRRSRRVRPFDFGGVEGLDRRVLPAVTATFSAVQGVLTVTGDAHDNAIAISRDAAGRIFVNGGAVNVRGGNATVVNTRLIELFGL